eukprot:TRINITY_DN7269_c0_g2_i1.p1 TRINITY_DN7269_c0_g2~~TRINITY_DN7269_c0_g2_i1.p1  ORF type:complete len:242 (+),score=37.49 TRINITY_DN7269_c0_g2_i1:60-728(+)
MCIRDRYIGSYIIKKERSSDTKNEKKVEVSQAAKEICRNFVKQCFLSAKNSSGIEAQSIIRICRSLGDDIEECHKIISKDENCYGKCAQKTEKKISNPRLWFAAYLSCYKCSAEYKNGLFKPQPICILAVKGCEKAVQKEENEQELQNLKEVCEGLKSEDGQQKFMSDVDKNPVCFGQCIVHCKEIINKKEHKAKDWRLCIDSCGICLEGAAERRVRRRNLE